MTDDLQELDPEISRLQAEWARDYRLAHRWIIVDGLDGLDVHDHTINGVAPMTRYPTKEQAAARLLQLMNISEPITPQNWPERICLGSVDADQDGTT